MSTIKIDLDPKDFWCLLAKKRHTIAFTQKLASAGLTPAQFDEALHTYGIAALRDGTVLWYNKEDTVDWVSVMMEISLVVLQYRKVIISLMAALENDIKEKLLDRLFTDISERKEVTAIGVNLSVSLEVDDE
jgi:hypothetical protein